MIKKLLFTLGLLLLPFNVMATPITFTHASVIVYCETFYDAKIVFEAALKAQPFSLPNACKQNRQFGRPVPNVEKPFLTQVSASLRDWEGDLMAIFQYESNRFQVGTIWMIIYNPDEVNGQEVQN